MFRRNSSVSDPLAASSSAHEALTLPGTTEEHAHAGKERPINAPTPRNANTTLTLNHNVGRAAEKPAIESPASSSVSSKHRGSSQTVQQLPSEKEKTPSFTDPFVSNSLEDEKSRRQSTNAPREIIDRLREFGLFASAPESFLEAIAGRLVMQVHQANSFIITEGEEARAMYWIIRGSVGIVSRDGEAVHAELGPGAFFGEIGILFDCPRTASVQAREKCILAVLTAGALNEVSPSYPVIEKAIRDEAQERLALLEKNRIVNMQSVQASKKRRKSSINGLEETASLKSTKSTSADTPSYKSRARNQSIGDLSKYLEHTGVREIIAEMPLFNSLPSGVIHRLALAVVPKSYPPFEMVIRQNTLGKDIYFIIDGQVEVLHDELQAPIARLTQGAYFGEMTFLSMVEKRTASVRTITEVDCLVVTGETLDVLCKEYPDIMKNIEATAKQRIGKNKSQQNLLRSASPNNVGPSSIYLNKRHNSISTSSSEHSSSIRDEDTTVETPHGKPLDLDPFHRKTTQEEEEPEETNGVGLFSKSWSTAGAFGSSPSMLLRPPTHDVAPHDSEDNGPSSRTEPASVEFNTYSLSSAPGKSQSPPTSPHNSEPSNPAFPIQPKIMPPNDFRLSTASTPSPSSSRRSSKISMFGGFVDSIPEEVETSQGLAHNFQNNSIVPSVRRRVSVGLVLHPRRVRQSARRMSSLFNVGPFPDLLQVKVFQFLDLKTLMAMQRVCHHWRQMLQSSSALLTELDLSIYNTTINDKTIVPITNFAGLRPKIVNINNCFHLTDEGFSFLVNGIGLANFRVFKMKSVWEVSGMAIMDLTVPSIGAHLEEIDLSNCRKVNDTTLSRLIGWVVPEHGDSGGAAPGAVVGCTNLKRLSLSYCKHITDRSMYHMAMFASDRIEAIDLTRCTTITDHGFSFWTLRSFSALRYLNLADCTFLTDKAIIAIATSAKGLEKLVLSFCCALTDVSVDVLSLGCPALKLLDLSFCGSAVSDASLSRVALHLLELRSLSTRGCVRVTREGIENFMAIAGARTSVMDLDVSQCRNVIGPIQSPVDPVSGRPRFNIRR